MDGSLAHNASEAGTGTSAARATPFPSVHLRWKASPHSRSGASSRIFRPRLFSQARRALLTGNSIPRDRAWVAPSTVRSREGIDTNGVILDEVLTTIGSG